MGAAHDFIQTIFNDRPGQVTVRRYRGAVDETADVSSTRERYAYQRHGDCEGTVWTVSRSHNNISTGIDWSAVSQVDRSRTNSRFVRVYGGSPDFGMVAFALPSEADAARVEAAMEFLRQGCAEPSAF